MEKLFELLNKSLHEKWLIIEDFGREQSLPNLRTMNHICSSDIEGEWHTCTVDPITFEKTTMLKIEKLPFFEGYAYDPIANSLVVTTQRMICFYEGKFRVGRLSLMFASAVDFNMKFIMFTLLDDDSSFEYEDEASLYLDEYPPMKLDERYKPIFRNKDGSFASERNVKCEVKLLRLK